MNANRLRQLLDSLGPNEQIPSNELAALYRPPAGGFIRREDTGETLYTNGQPGGIYDQPTDYSTPQDGGGPPPQFQAQPQQQRIKIAGYGNGIMSDVGEMMGPAPQLEMSRGQVDTPKGRGYYGKDGNVYVRGPEGWTKVLLGYDRDASYVANKRNVDMQQSRLNLDKTQGDIEHQQEVTAGLRAMNSVREDPTSQVVLEKRYGKAEKGYRWDESGRMVPIAGSPEDAASQSGLDSAGETLRKIDEMIGKRDASGKLVDGSAAHPGFEDVVGATWRPGMRYIPGTHAADFDARLNEVKGGAFLKAFETLKGGGQITEVEGKKATDAITRMNRSQSEDEFVKAALEFRSIVERGMQRAQAQRGGVPVAQTGSVAIGPAEQSQAIFKAKKAIQSGADANLVKQRLEAAGITNHGL